MNTHGIHSQKKHLKELYKRATLFNDEPEMLSHWAKYLCVLTSGLIENALRQYISEFAKEKSHPYVSNYVVNQIGEFKNPTMGKILDVLNKFNRIWRDELEEYARGERKDAIDSIVSNRHQIAHGRSIGLTFVQMEKYFDRAVEVIEFVGTKCDPSRK